MDYMQALRQAVGPRPLIMAGAGIILFNEAEQILLLRRTDNHTWGIPGGAMDLGEHIEETARRELREETALEAGPMRLFGVFSGPELYHRYPDGAEVYNLSVVYLGRQEPGEIRLQREENTQAVYFAVDALPEEISPPVQPVLAAFVEEWRAGRIQQEGFQPLSR